ncbi:hypothetical protein MP228_011959 [Amoeboaphelidium protococcarum]|nr:hypothetical protein MP228_011959 [Amoeboaphelidium protococcarum]
MNHTEVSTAGSSSPLINKILCHPQESTCITEHETRKMKFYDITSGQCTFEMIAHLDSVSSLDISPNGQAVITALLDSSFHLWDVTIKTFLQEFSAHRTKHDESIHFALFHPRLRGPEQTCDAAGGSFYHRWK